MKTSCRKIWLAFERNSCKGKRLVFVGDEAKEKAPAAAVPEEQTIERRKIDARNEIDSIYELGKYNTYNFRKLPQDFKDKMRADFGQWIDANIAKYDEDKKSGIDANEYKKFKDSLNEKVQGILDRLVELKKEKKKEAEEMQETAEQAREKQKRLEGVDVAKVSEANLENADGIYTELLKYQKDYENEAKGFSTLAGAFSDTKEQVDNANKSHYTGATAFGEYLVSLAPWTEDIPEVKTAKEAKEKTVGDFRTKLLEMRNRQKDRQKRGQTLNGAPEKAKQETQKKYGEQKDKVTENRNKVAAAQAENAKRKQELENKIRQINDARKKLQEDHDKLLIKMAAAQKKRDETGKRTKEMAEAEKGLQAAQQALTAQKGSGEAKKETSAQVEGAKTKAGEARKGLEEGLDQADMQLGGWGQTISVMQKKLIELGQGKDECVKGVGACGKTETTFAAKSTELSKLFDDLSKEEETQMAQIDSLDEAVASTVLEVDTSNFELIKKGEEYLKMLNGMSISGPGLLDTAGAMIKGIPGAETAMNWSGDKLSGAWQWAKEAPFLKYVIGGAQDMGKDWVKMWDSIGDGLSWVGDKLHLQDAWDWMSEASKHLNIGHPTGNNLADAILDTLSGGGLGTIIEVFAGVTEGAKDLVKGLGMMIRDPIDTIKGLGGLLNHPGMIIDALIQKDKWSDESTSKIIGRMLVDVITTCTGAGATATGIKTALAALKIGEMSLGRAILLGVETFGRTFIKDIGSIIKGVVLSPKYIVQGGANLLKTITRGGKKLEPAEGALSAAAKRAAAAEEAYKAVEATRGKPELFRDLVRKNPHIIDLHGEHLSNLAKRERAASKAAKAEKVAKPEEVISAEEVTKPEPAARKLAPEEVTGVEPAVKRGRKKQGSVAAVKEEITSETGVAEGVAKEGEEAIKPAAEKTRPSLREAETPRVEPVREKPRTGAKEAKAAEAEAEVLNLAKLAVVKDFEIKHRRPEMMRVYYEVEEKAAKSPAFRELVKNGYDFHWYADRLPDHDLKLLASRIDDLTPELLESILTQRYKKTFNRDGSVVRYYEGAPLGKGGYGVVSDGAYVFGDGERLEFGALKKIKDIDLLEDELASVLQTLRSERGNMSADEITALQKRQSALTFQIHNMRDVFKRELRGFAGVDDMPNKEGLLRPRVLSPLNLEDPVIIYDKIHDPSGRDVNLGGRLMGNERLENKVQYLIDSIKGLDNLHENGWLHLDFKPGNVFVGMEEGEMKGHLGDLSVIHYSDLPFLEVTPVKIKDPLNPKKTTTQYALIRKSPTGSIMDSRQIAITPSYFSAQHMEKVIGEARVYLKDLDARGLRPEDYPAPKSILATGDANQVAVTLARDYVEITDLPALNKGLADIRGEIRKTAASEPEKLAKLARKEKEHLAAISAAIADRKTYGEAAIKEFQDGMRGLGQRLQDTNNNISMAEVAQEISALDAQLQRAKVRQSKIRPAGGPVQVRI